MRNRTLSAMIDIKTIMKYLGICFSEKIILRLRG